MEVSNLKNILAKNLYGISWEMNFYLNVFVARPWRSQSWKTLIDDFKKIKDKLQVFKNWRLASL